MKQGIGVLKIIGALAMGFSLVLLVGGLFARICVKRKEGGGGELTKMRREKRLRRQQQKAKE